MTKKDYIKLADAIAEAKIRLISEFGCSTLPHIGINLVTVEIADMLARDNTRFDALRFEQHIKERFKPYDKGESNESI